MQTLGRLADPDEFGNIVVKQSNDSVVRLKDVARVELAALDYGVNSYLDKNPATGLGIFQLPGSNAIDTAKKIKATMAELSKSFPAGLKYDIIYNPTDFIQQSVDAVVTTILEAVVLVVLVVILFLQTWRAAIIPIVAIPVSLIGTFFLLAAFGFSLNNLSLFGLVLAIGIVVDDAIVVVENVERNMANGLEPARSRLPHDGGGRRGAGRHRAGADGGVRAVGVHHRHLRPVLPAVRADHRRRHDHLAHRVADAVAGACARCCSSRIAKATSTAWYMWPVHAFFRALQLELRQALARIRLVRRAHRAPRGGHAASSMPASSPSA